MKNLLPLWILFSAITLVGAQDSPKKEQPKKDEATSKSGPSAADFLHKTAYRLDFKVFELEDGKRVNQRDFSMNASSRQNGGPTTTLRIGTRVPVGSGEKQNYLDVGFRVYSQLTDQEGKLVANINLEMSSFALPEQNTDPRSSSMPVLRNSNFNVETLITPGKPQIIASIDDLNSKKKTQVELTATRID